MKTLGKTTRNSSS